MGLFTKSMVILLIAASTPLIYKQFANEGTVKFMSSYYSNYNMIDKFLRQSANHLESAKDYLPATQRVKEVVDKLNQQVLSVIESVKSKAPIGQKPQEKQEKASESMKTDPEPPKMRMSSCPGDDKPMRLWSKEELAKFDGSNGEEIYLAFLGLVYDVTANMQHYASGAEYNAFAGRDATRAFITGNFTHDLTDDIQDLDESLYSHIEGWASFYNASYPVVGRIVGSFFDAVGCPTGELARVHQVFSKLIQEKENVREQERDFPECNSEWNSDLKKGRVWCSKKSGGVERDWVGVPRIYDNGEAPRCACINLDGPEAAEASKFMSVYPGCDPKAEECPLTQ